MSNAHKILLIDEKNQAPSDQQILLNIAGYDVDFHNDIFIALNMYAQVRETERKYDLIILVSSSPCHHYEQFFQNELRSNLILLTTAKECSVCKKVLPVVCQSSNLMTTVIRRLN